MDRQTARQKAMELVEQMTVEEMASQMRYDAPAIPRLQIPAARRSQRRYRHRVSAGHRACRHV